jgi:hypothetical protein
MLDLRLSRAWMGRIENEEAFCISVGRRLHCRLDDLMTGAISRVHSTNPSS